jgi:putative PIN family toxin of toxin-antitoxin system
VPLVCRETFAEFRKVLSYPKFRLAPLEIAALIENELLPFVEVAEEVEPVEGVCRDPHDDKFLAVAASGRAAYLVTGDRDLLVLGEYKGCQVVGLAEFLETIPTK